MMEWGCSFTPWSVYLQRKCPRYLLDRRLGDPQSRFGRVDIKKKIPFCRVHVDTEVGCWSPVCCEFRSASGTRMEMRTARRMGSLACSDWELILRQFPGWGIGHSDLWLVVLSNDQIRKSFVTPVCSLWTGFSTLWLLDAWINYRLRFTFVGASCRYIYRLCLKLVSYLKCTSL